MVPSRRALALLAIGLAVALLPAVGFPRAWPAVALAWAVTAVALVAGALFTPRRGEIAWTLALPGALHVGARGRMVLDVGVPRRAVMVEAAVGLSDDLTPQPPQRARVTDAPIRLEWTLAPTRRGTASVETLWIRVEGPLRLWARWIVAPVERVVPVLPNVPQVRAAAIRFFSDRDVRTGLKIERHRGVGSEFDSLKEFVTGDDRRYMDWKASARHRRLLCRQHRAERNHQVILALDTGRLMSETLGDITRLDHALNSALVLAYVCLKNGDRVGLFTFDARVGSILEPVHGVGGMHALLDVAGRVGYCRDETNFTLGLTTLYQRVRRRALVILITDFADTVTAELMLEHVARIARRHFLVFVSIRDPQLVAVAGAPPDDLETLSGAVVARDLLRDRDRVHRRLQHLGVRALDVTPERVTTGLINQYLDIKRHERV